MKCPHCNTSVGFIKLLIQSLPFAGKAMKQSLSPDGNGAVEEELYCPYCHHRLYIGIRPVMVFLGLLLAEFGFLKFGRSFIKISKYGLSAYIILSLMAAIICSLRLNKKPGIFHKTRPGFKRSLNFALAAMLPLTLVLQIGFFYYNLIPSKADLKEIGGTIGQVSYHLNGLPDYILLRHQVHDNRFYVIVDENSAREWQLKEKLTEDMDVRLLADASKNIFYPEGAYNIWEISSGRETVIPYEAVRQVRVSIARADNWDLGRMTLFFFSGYLLTLYWVRKEENSLVSGQNGDRT